MMKRATFFLIILVFIIVIIVPGVLIISCDSHIFNESSQDKRKKPKEDNLTIKLYLTKEKKIEEIPLEEYIKGVVAAEMPASFHIEALKAQAVAARTYTYRRWKKAGGTGCALCPEADICDNFAHCQAWIDKKEMLAKWGIFSYYHYNSKINQSIDNTAGKIIYYDDSPIDPLFFSTSNGKTENSEDVFSAFLPYLRSVESSGEEISPRFKSEKKISTKNLYQKLKEKWPDIIVDENNPMAQWKIIEKSVGGRVKTLKIGNKIVNGTEIRGLLGLNSTDFSWENERDSIKFICRGYGHGVGMSQYGANIMAKSGTDFVEILKHYYTGVQIKDINNIIKSNK